LKNGESWRAKWASSLSEGDNDKKVQENYLAPRIAAKGRS